MSVCEQTCKRVNPYPRNGKYSTVAGEKLLTERIEQKLSYPMIASASDTPVSDGSEYAKRVLPIYETWLKSQTIKEPKGLETVSSTHS